MYRVLYFLSPLWQSLYFQGLTFVVRIILGPSAVAIFNTVRTVARTANQGFNLVISAVFPDFQFELSAGNLTKARKIFVFMLTFNFVIAIISILVLFLFGLDVYEIWINNAMNPDPLMWNIFLIGIGFNSFWWSFMFVFQAANEPYEYTIACIVCSFIVVISSYFLCQYIGLIGAAVGCTLLDILLAIYMVPKGVKYLNLNYYTFQESISSLCFMLYNKVKNLRNNYL